MTSMPVDIFSCPEGRGLPTKKEAQTVLIKTHCFGQVYKINKPRYFITIKELSSVGSVDLVC
jgi:hypothetical protein